MGSIRSSNLPRTPVQRSQLFRWAAAVHLALHRFLHAVALIVTEGFPSNPMTRITIWERLKARGLLTDPRIGPLHILDRAAVAE
ncbi:MAG: hypothetical protein M3406_12510 [Chloroflexota bacterium]|nr:hypothetical protein [Chloroflexota bacterium]